MDIEQLLFNKNFGNNNTNKDVIPGSLLDSFLKQDESAYIQTSDAPLPVDQVFMESRALVSVCSDAWQENGLAPSTSHPVVVKEEAKQSVMAVIDQLEEMAHNGDFCAALKNLDVDDAQLMEWETSLKRLSQDGDTQSSVRTELDCILTDDIFDYIDSMLFKEKGDDCLNASPPSCLPAVGNNQQASFTQAPQLSATALSEQQLFQARSPDWIYSQMNAGYAHLQDTMNGGLNTAQGLAGSAQMFSGTQKLSHHGPLMAQPDTSLPSLQQLQLQDIFSPSIELPELTVHGTSADVASVPFQACGQAHNNNIGLLQGIPGQMPSSQPLLCPQNNLQAPALAANGQLLQSSVRQPNNVAPGVMDILPPLIPCNDLNSRPDIPVPFSAACLQGRTPFENQQLPQWPQSQYKLPHAGIMQNGHAPMPACHSQTSEKQTFLHAGAWPRSVNGLAHTQQGGLACGQEATHSSCMFNQHFSSSPSGGEILALSGSSCQRGAYSSLDQSPPQGSCYFQWGRSEPVVGTSAINQENANISPVTVPPPNASSSEHVFSIQRYLE